MNRGSGCKSGIEQSRELVRSGFSGQTRKARSGRNFRRWRLLAEDAAKSGGRRRPETRKNSMMMLRQKRKPAKLLINNDSNNGTSKPA
jgi:hypothetical protein